jgi:hypothetical protein
MRFGGSDLGSFRVSWAEECGDFRGVFGSGVHKQLTSDVLYWALSPGWSGEIPDGVPFPSVLRR